MESDLDKYYDIYEISRSDMQDAEVSPTILSERDDPETLKELKLGFQKLHINRKLYLCSLLALNANGSRSDFRAWSPASETLEELASETEKLTYAIDEVLSEEAGGEACSLCYHWSLTCIRQIFQYPLRPRSP